MTTTFVIVDNIPSHLEGSRNLVERVEGATVVDSLDFPEAMVRPSWDDVDFVICDMADEPLGEDTAKALGREDEQEERHRVTDYMSIDLIVKIKTMSSKTQVIAVTGHSFVFENPILRRMVREAKADHFVYRADLDAIIAHLGKSGGDVVADMDALRTPIADDEIPEYGITRRTRVLEMVRTMSKDRYREFLQSSKVFHQYDRVSRDMRREVEGSAGEIKGVDPKGNPTPRSPRVSQLKKVWQSATRIPEEFRNRGR